MRQINAVRPTEAMLTDVLAKSIPGRVWNLAAGDPNLSVCPALAEAYQKADPEETHRYGSSAGLTALRSKLWKNPDQVILANGAKQLIYMSLAAVTHPGDHVVIVGPCWASYMRICDILGLRYTLVIGKPENRFIPGAEDVTAAITSETAAVLLNNPNNPTGVIYPEEFVCAIVDAVTEKDTWLIADEIYACLSSRPFHSLRSLIASGENERIIVIDGFSKCLNVTGWRLGYVLACPEVIRSLIGLQSQMSGPPSTLIQKIVNDAWDGLTFSTFEDYRERIDLLCQIPKFAAFRPEAGFYFYLPVAERWGSGPELCAAMLKQYAIAMTPGEDYGVPGTVRISVASETAASLSEILEPLSLV